MTPPKPSPDRALGESLIHTKRFLSCGEGGRHDGSNSPCLQLTVRLCRGIRVGINFNLLFTQIDNPTGRNPSDSVNRGVPAIRFHSRKRPALYPISESPSGQIESGLGHPFGLFGSFLNSPHVHEGCFWQMIPFAVAQFFERGDGIFQFGEFTGFPGEDFRHEERL